MENNNQKKGQQQDNKAQKNNKRKWIIVIILAILVIGLFITFRMNGSPQVAETISKIPGINTIINTETKDSEDEFDIEKERERLQQEVDDNTLNARIASSIEPDTDDFVYLSLKNKYDDKLLQVSIIDEVSNESYYISPALNPGDEIDYGKLSYVPEVGEYDCIAYFYYYTLDEEPISMVGAKIKLNVKGE